MRTAALRTAVLLWIALATPAAAQQATGHETAPAAAAARALTPVTVDGQLDDAAWSDAAVISEFTQFAPDEAQPASERTEVRILFDDDALYVGARLHDTGPVTSRLGRRDLPRGDSDWFGITVDSYHDHQTAYAFFVNPSGVRRDAARTENSTDVAWDAVWEAAVQQDDGGWTAELRIPFSQLRFNAADVQTWGLQLEREIARRGELSLFAFTPRSEQAGIGRFGHLSGLSGLRPGRPLELMPYTVGRTERVDRGPNPFRDRGESALSAGLDLKYRLTSNLIVDATINPDFGQVEVDPAVVNLSALETFYEEKRPFFLEGAGIFDFGVGAVGPGSAYRNVFYSRRIGRKPQIGAPSPFADAPDATTILGAAKLTGRPQGWSLGILQALTQEEVGRVEVGPDVAKYTAEPLTNYLIGRGMRTLNDGLTRIGVIGTSVNRDLDDERAVAALRSAAYTGGVDFSHEWSRRTWRFSGYLTGSHVRGDTVAIRLAQLSPQRYYQRPDATSLELDPRATSLSGYAGQLQIFKQAGQHWIGDVALYAVSPGYEINDLGFQSRADQLGSNGRIVYQQTSSGRVLRQYSVSATYGITRNHDGDIIGGTLNLGSNGQLLNLSGYNLALGVLPSVYDDRLTRGGPLARTPRRVQAMMGFNTDPRPAVTGSLMLQAARDDAGGSSVNASITGGIKPSPRWSLQLSPTFSRTHSAAQYLGAVTDPTAPAETFGRRYLFSELEQTTVSLESRLNFTFSPTASLQLYAQPFISSGDYATPAQLAAPRTFTFDVFGRDTGTVTEAEGAYTVDPDGSGPAASFTVPSLDFNLRSLRGNAVFRWEWRPGSTLYLAWQQSRSDDARVGDFDLDRDRQALFRTVPDNVLLLKISYWMNP